MNKRIYGIAMLWFAAICFLAVILMTCGCNPTKKVLKDPVAMKKVALAYIEQNPPKNDTIFTAGKDTVIHSTKVIRDSIPLPYPVNHKYTERHYIDRIVVDTVTVKDYTMVNELRDEVVFLRKTVESLEKNLREAKRDNIIWMVVAFAMLTFIILKPVILGYIKRL